MRKIVAEAATINSCTSWKNTVITDLKNNCNNHNSNNLRGTKG
jgi:hypothetical protein